MEVGTYYNRETLVEMLSFRVVTVKFRKVNGEIRTLRGTLKEDVIPSVQEHKAPNPETVTVWDVDNAGWRSFRTDSVLEVD